MKNKSVSGEPVREHYHEGNGQPLDIKTKGSRSDPFQVGIENLVDRVTDPGACGMEKWLLKWLC